MNYYKYHGNLKKNISSSELVNTSTAIEGRVYFKPLAKTCQIALKGHVYQCLKPWAYELRWTKLGATPF